MDCPRCEQTLVARTLAHSTVDECGTCGGIWFDEGELQDARDEADPDLSWQALDVFTDASRFALSRSSRPCPRCLLPMATVDYDDAGLQLDSCPTCEGIWFDQGEFAALVRLLVNEATRMDVPDYVREAIEEAADLVRNPKHVAAEWSQLSAVLRMLRYRLLAENPRLVAALAAMQDAGSRV